jgi:hypothetical protein
MFLLPVPWRSRKETMATTAVKLSRPESFFSGLQFQGIDNKYL